MKELKVYECNRKFFKTKKEAEDYKLMQKRIKKLSKIFFMTETRVEVACNWDKLKKIMME